MKIQAILLGFFILFAAQFNPLCAQKKSHDALYLKNGSIIRGKIIEHTSEVIRIRTNDGSEWVFPSSDMDRIEKESTQQVVSPKGYQGYFSGGAVFGRDRYGLDLHGGVIMVNGYRFLDRYYAGLGIGIESFDGPIAPLFLDGRYDLLLGETRPFVFSKLGWAWQLDGTNSSTYKNHGGLMTEAGIGLQRYIGKSIGLVFSIGYRHQRLAYTYTDSWTGSKTRVSWIYDRALFRFGLTF